jgi:hypothetical protein
MEAVEHFAKVTLAARQLGAPQLLNMVQIEALEQARRRYLNRCVARANRAFGAYELRFFQIARRN